MCIHGYSAEYPKFLAKIFIHIVYTIYMYHKMKKIQLKIGFSTLLHNLGSISPLSNPSGPAQTPPTPTSPHLRPQPSPTRPASSTSNPPFPGNLAEPPTPHLGRQRNGTGGRHQQGRRRRPSAPRTRARWPGGRAWLAGLTARPWARRAGRGQRPC